MGLEEAFEPIEAYNKAVVMNNTWGHLAPEPGRKYAGYIYFALGDYGDIVPLAVDFIDLPDSPWFFEDLNDYIGTKTKGKKGGTLFRFTGTYIKFKNGGYRFSGKVREVQLKDLFF